MGYLREDGEQYPTLSLTPDARAALKNRAPIMGRIEEVRQKSPRVKPGEANVEHDAALFGLLRDRRKALADASGVPPYVIFSDRTLVEMAAYFPQSPQRLLDISGVGQVKARQFGEEFLDVIRTYCQERGINEVVKEVGRIRDDGGRRYVQVGEAFNGGQSVRSLAERYNVTTGTIMEHLTRYVAAGHTLRQTEDFLSMSSASPDQQAAAFAAFAEVGTDFLRPVYEKLAEAVSYDELKILRLGYLSQTGGS
jgi:ATP-dependent DNA helicase RecQ